MISGDGTIVGGAIPGPVVLAPRRRQAEQAAGWQPTRGLCLSSYPQVSALTSFGDGHAGCGIACLSWGTRTFKIWRCIVEHDLSHK